MTAITDPDTQTNDRQLRAIADTIPGILCQFRAQRSGEMELYYTSGRSGELFGVDGDPASFFQKFMACIAPGDREAFLISIHTAVHNATKWEFKGKYIKPTGEEIDILAVAEPSGSGDNLLFNGVVLDITAHELAKRALVTPGIGCQSPAKMTGWGSRIPENEEGTSPITPPVTEVTDKKPAGQGGVSSGIDIQTSEELIHELEVHQIELRMQNDELRRAHLELQESQARFIDLYDFAPMGYLSLSDKALVINANLTVAKLLGIESGKLKNTRFRRFINPQDAEEWDRYFIKVLKHEDKHSAAARLRRDDGSTFPARLESIRIGATDSSAMKVRVAISDISDIRVAEEAQDASETRYRRLFETAHDGILILDADTGQIEDVNPYLIKMLGFSREQFLGKKIWEIGQFKDIVANKDNFEELQRKEYIRYEDLPLETADGRTIAVEFVSNVYMVNNRKVIQCNIRDITDRKLVEEALRRKNDEMEGYFTNTLDLISIADTSGNFRRLNREWESALGYSPEELGGKRLIDFVHPADRETTLQALTDLTAGRKVLQFMNRCRHKDGSYRWIEWRSFLLGNSIFSSARDITERKKMSELIEASLAEKEILLKEIHHRVKNNLQVISSLLNMQIRKSSDPNTINALRDSQNRVLSMALVHEHLYKGKDFTYIDLTNYIHALGTGLFDSYETEKMGIRFDLNIREIYVDISTAIPLGLISNELITNSLKYAFSGKKDGRITITASEDPQFLTFVIADDGGGLPEGITLENQTSLGLRLVNSLTSQLKGTVAINRTGGTKFEFRFPKPAVRKPPEIPGLSDTT